ncbi:MAG: hypothetical protein ABS876_03070 [Ruminococcus sp.]
MKVKFSVIPFIPAALAMIVFRMMSIFGADANGKFLGMDKMVVAYTVIGISLGLFLVCAVINFCDRKTAPVYPVKKNLAAGILSILSGAMVIASSFGSFMNTTTDSEYYVMTLICALFSLPAGIAFFLMSRAHFVGKTIISGISILFVFPALWGCSELVHSFLEATKVSISATDLSPLFCYIFITLYYFSHAMVLSRIKGRNPVKGCFIYGLPAIALLISNALYTFFTGMQEGTGYVSALSAAQFLVLALYAMVFVLEMTVNSYTKEEIEIIEGLPGEDEMHSEEKKFIKTESLDEFVVSDRDDTEPDPDELEEMERLQASEDFTAVPDFDELVYSETSETNRDGADASAQPEFAEIPVAAPPAAQSMDDFIIGSRSAEDMDSILQPDREDITNPDEDSLVGGAGFVAAGETAERAEEKGKHESRGFMKKLFRKKGEEQQTPDEKAPELIQDVQVQFEELSLSELASRGRAVKEERHLHDFSEDLIIPGDTGSFVSAEPAETTGTDETTDADAPDAPDEPQRGEKTVDRSDIDDLLRELDSKS